MAVALSVSLNRRRQKVSLSLPQPQFCAPSLQEPSGSGVFSMATLTGGGLSRGSVAVEHELQPADGADFKGAMTGAY
jgi:hypothetical protein